MTRTRSTYKTRLLLTAGALFVFPGIAFAAIVFPEQAQAQTQAETSQLMNRLNEMENQVQTLSRAVYKGDVPPPSALAPVGDANAAANNEARLSAIEDQQRKMTGEVEKLTYDVQQLKDRLDKLQADNEQRFQQVEHGGQPSSGETTVAPPAASGGTLGETSSTGAGSGAEALYEDAFNDVKDGKYDAGEAKLKQFLSQYPGHSLTPNAQYWLGETYYVRGDYKSAAKTFAQGYQDYPKSGKAEDSLYKLGLSLAKLGKKDDACLSLRQIQKSFPNDAGTVSHKAQDQIRQLGCP